MSKGAVLQGGSLGRLCRRSSELCWPCVQKYICGLVHNWPWAPAPLFLTDHRCAGPCMLPEADHPMKYIFQALVLDCRHCGPVPCAAPHRTLSHQAQSGQQMMLTRNALLGSTRPSCPPLTADTGILGRTPALSARPASTAISTAMDARRYAAFCCSDLAKSRAWNMNVTALAQTIL